MTARRFAWMLQCRGPAISDWPVRDNLAALALLRTDQVARDMLAAALADEDAPLSDCPALERLLCPVRRALAPLSPLWRAARWGVLAACLCGGICLGVLTAEGDGIADLLPTMHPSPTASVLAALEP